MRPTFVPGEQSIALAPGSKLGPYEVVASLNHPNVAAIHGLEEAGGARALIMELVEGATLAERIKSAPIPP